VTDASALPLELAEQVRAGVAAAVQEDVGSGDITAVLIPAQAQASATVITRDAGVHCGNPWILETCARVDAGIRVELLHGDGDDLVAGASLCRLSGPARGLLTAERTLLNFVGLLAGTATRTRKLARLIEHTPARLLDTRKTVPGLRLAQKYAVRCGGGSNHRVGLFDAFLIKENHIAAAGGITAAVATARGQQPELPVEVEVESLAELREALEAGADRVLIDNFNLADTRAAVALAAGALEIEASGSIDETTITAIAEAGVDYISVGSITKQVLPLDLSMRFDD